MIFYHAEVMVMSKGTPIVTLRLDKEWRDWVEMIADEKGGTASDVIRTAIQEYVWNHYGGTDANK